MLTPRDVEWVAGFLEGEGSFSFGTTSRIIAAQVQREPLERLERLLGGNIRRYATNGPRSKGHIHHWRINGRRAVGVMMTIFGIMSTRRKLQIRKVLDRWKSGPGSGSSQRAKTHCPRGHPYDEQNTRRYVNARGFKARECLTCRREVYGKRIYGKRRLRLVKPA